MDGNFPVDPPHASCHTQNASFLWELTFSSISQMAKIMLEPKNLGRGITETLGSIEVMEPPTREAPPGTSADQKVGSEPTGVPIPNMTING